MGSIRTVLIKRELSQCSYMPKVDMMFTNERYQWWQQGTSSLISKTHKIGQDKATETYV